MTTYGTTLTVDYTRASNNTTPAHSHTLQHGTCSAANVNSTVGRWVFLPDADDSIGSQGTIVLSIQTGNSVFQFEISFVCNNKLQNSVTVSGAGAYFEVNIEPSADVIKTQAPLDVVVYITQK